MPGGSKWQGMHQQNSTGRKNGRWKANENRLGSRYEWEARVHHLFPTTPEKDGEIHKSWGQLLDKRPNLIVHE